MFNPANLLIIFAAVYLYFYGPREYRRLAVAVGGGVIFGTAVNYWIETLPSTERVSSYLIGMTACVFVILIYAAVFYARVALRRSRARQLRRLLERLDDSPSA